MMGLGCVVQHGGDDARMYVLVLTGGLGSGKSTAARRLAALGAQRIDTDAVAAQVRDTDEVIWQLVSHFGLAVLGREGADEVRRQLSAAQLEDPAALGDQVRAQGGVDTAALARIAFATPEGTQFVNSLMHPIIFERVAGIVTDSPCFADEAAPVAVVEVPLLVAGMPYLELADEVMCVTAPVETRVVRAIARGMNESDARERIARQTSDAERIALADTVIANDGTVEELLAKVDAWWAERERTGFVSVRRRA